MMIGQYQEQFMRDSNAIEGEVDMDDKQIPAQLVARRRGRLNPGDMEAIQMVEDMAQDGKPMTCEVMLELHKMLGDYLDKPWVGRWRNCNVYVGNHAPPSHKRVPKLMEVFADGLSVMDSFTAHVTFELIHPFQDLNGRVGRLIWLYRALDEGYNYNPTFLHKFYYQSLAHNKEEVV